MRAMARIVVVALGVASWLPGSTSAGTHDAASAAKSSHPVSTRAAKTAAFTDARVRALLPTLLNGACPLPDVVTGGQIDSAGLTALRREGVKTVLDLRAADEDRGFDEPAVARAERLDYVALPVTAGTLDDRTFDRFRKLMSDDSRGSILVHCASGNRVGAVMIPYLVLDRGLSVDSALAVTRRGGLKSEPMTKKAIDYVDRHLAQRRGARPGHTR